MISNVRDKRLELAPGRFGDLFDFAVGFPTIEYHADRRTFDRLTFTRTQFYKVCRCKLRKAHQENDRAVMAAYGFKPGQTTESECVAELFKMYQELTK